MEKQNEMPKKNKAPYFFMVILLLSVIGLIKIALTGESSFRTAGPYTAESDPDKFWFDVGTLIFFTIISASIVWMHYSGKLKKKS